MSAWLLREHPDTSQEVRSAKLSQLSPVKNPLVPLPTNIVVKSEAIIYLHYAYYTN